MDKAVRPPRPAADTVGKERLRGAARAAARCVDKMRFRSFSLRRFLLYLSSALLYPVWVWISSPEGQRLLKLTDALTVMGLVFLILAVLFSLIRHGDFDIMEYVALRSLRKGDVKSFDAFKEDKKEKRKDSLNYPFWTCVLLFLVAGFITLFVY